MFLGTQHDDQLSAAVLIISVSTGRTTRVSTESCKSDFPLCETVSIERVANDSFQSGELLSCYCHQGSPLKNVILTGKHFTN